MNYKNPDFYRRSENFFPKRDNSAFLRKALSKKYKEDTSKNLNNQENQENDNELINNEKELNDERDNNIKYSDYSTKSKNIQRANYNKAFFQTYNTKGNLYNNKGAFYNKNKKENDNFYINNNNQVFLDRMNYNNKNKTRYNFNKNFDTNISGDNVYEEFIINYNRGTNPIDNNRLSNTLDRKKPNIPTNNPMNNRNNKIYSKVALNNGIYKIDKKSNKINNFINDDDRIERVEYFSSTYHPNYPYHKRKILDIKEKEPIENGMPDKIKKELYYKNNRNNFTNYNFFNKKLKSNVYNYNFNTYNQNMNNLDRNYNNNMLKNNYSNSTYENDYYFNTSQKEFMMKNNNKLAVKKNNDRKINLFLEHLSEYCVLYYHNIIKQLFTYLKKSKAKKRLIQYKPIDKTKSFNIIKPQHSSNYRNYITKVIQTHNSEDKITKVNEERKPYHKSTELIIDRIRYNNQSKSPDKKYNIEMFRDINELSKKYELINHRKNKQSLNNDNLKTGKDLSFDSESVKRSKQKEKWEKTLEKERENKKIKEKNKLNKDAINNNKKNNLIYIQNNNEKKEINQIKTNSIRNKYKKLNTKNKYNMLVVKKIQTKDKKIHINIKYLNYYKPMKIKNNKNSDNKFKSLQKSTCTNITLFAYKDKNKKSKKENNNNGKENKKLASIKEEKENKIELSFSEDNENDKVSEKP